MLSENGIMDVDGLCSYLHTSRSTIYKLAQNGQLPGHKVGRLWRFTQEEIDEWLKSTSGANTMAMLRNADVEEVGGAHWNEMLSEAGFTTDQVETLRAFSFDNDQKIIEDAIAAE